MSQFDYLIAEKILDIEPPFASLIMAAAMRADQTNLAFLRAAFPDEVEEAYLRYNSPEGKLPSD